MVMPRRALIAFAVIIAAFVLPVSAGTAADDEVAAYKRAVDESFAAWVKALWPDAEALGISRAVFDANTKGLKLDWSLPHLVYPDPAVQGGPALPKVLADQMKPSRQPEFEPPAGYFNPAALNALAATGRTKMAQLAPELAAIQKQYDVPASIIVAIWGRETGFGKVDMPFDALSAIATQGFMGRRPDEFRNESLVGAENSARRPCDARHDEELMGRRHGLYPIPADRFRQIRRRFQRRRQARHLEHGPDALASAANSLHSQGWDGEQTWAYEVKLPAKFDCTLQGPDKARPISEWIKLGVVRVKDRPFPDEQARRSALHRAAGGIEGSRLPRHQQLLGAEAL